LNHPLKPIALKTLSKRPLVSVLMSNYNYAEFLPEACESVLSQNWGNLEFIICDDGSTDHSREIISRYCGRDSRIRLIAKPNGGQASGFNAAFSACSGDLICFLDSDDLFRPSKVTRMVEAHQQNAGAGFGIHRVQRVNRSRSPQGVWPLRSVLPSGWHGEKMLKSGGVLAYMPPTSGLSLHRTVANRVFPLPETPQLTGVADQVVTRLAPLLTSVVRVEEPLAEYRLHDTNSYVRSALSAQSILREITICHHLWFAQRDFLFTISPDLVRELQPVEKSSYLIYLEYIHARLSRSPESHVSYRRFLADLREQHAGRTWFWKYSIYLPAPIFSTVVNVMSRPGVLKEIAARLRGVS
jgi:glycosyltransferase involved in cell wall biosynthesis